MMEDIAALHRWQAAWTDDPCDDCTHWLMLI